MLKTFKNNNWIVQIKLETRRLKLNRKIFTTIVCGILDEVAPKNLHRSGIEISFVFTTDSRIMLLNRDFRGKNKPTDVLSFPQLEDHSGLTTTLGDVVISLPTALRQSKMYGVTLNEEILRLVIHGILHLLGFDHEKVPKKVAARMRRTEKKLFSKFQNDFFSVF